MQNFMAENIQLKICQKKRHQILEGYEFNEKVPIKELSKLSTEILDQISILKRKTGITKNNTAAGHFIFLTMRESTVEN